MQHKFWTTLDNTTYRIGRAFRHGNGNLRVALAVVILAAMVLYPLCNI